MTQAHENGALVPATRSMMHPEAGALMPAPPRGSVVMVDDDGGDFAIPLDELRAPFLQWSGKSGKFTDTVTGEVLDSIRLVLLKHLPDTRIAWNKDTSAPKEEMILCKSYDTVYPVNVLHPAEPVDPAHQAAIGAALQCDGCPLSAFVLDKTGRLRKSPCSQYMNLAVAFADDEEPIPFVLGVKSTSLKPMRKLLNELTWLQVAKASKRIPRHALVFELRAGDQAGQGAEKYYPLTGVVRGEVLPKERWAPFTTLWKVVSQQTIDTTAVIIADDEDLEVEQPEDDGQHHVTPEEILSQDAREPMPEAVVVDPAYETFRAGLEDDEAEKARQHALIDAQAARTDPADVRKGRGR